MSYCLIVIFSDFSIFTLERSLSKTTIFHERAGTKILSPVFCNILIAGLPSYVFTRWQTQYMEREHTKFTWARNEILSELIYFFLIVALIFKLVGSYGQTFHLHVDKPIWFRY